MLATKEYANGHYTAINTPWATDYVWVPSEEVVNERHLYEVLYPWHAAYAEWVIEERAHPEEQQRMEMETL